MEGENTLSPPQSKKNKDHTREDFLHTGEGSHLCRQDDSTRQLGQFIASGPKDTDIQRGGAGGGLCAQTLWREEG